MAGAPYNLKRLERGVRPFRLVFIPRLLSTNSHAARLRQQQRLFAPALVLAGRQLAGRGRGANRWWSAAGGIAATFVLPVETRLAAHHVPLIAGLATRDVLAECMNDPAVQVKWPNDIHYAGRKLAGLLCERFNRVDLVGVGINVNQGNQKIPRALAGKVLFLSQIARRTLDRTDLLIALATRLHQMLGLRNEVSFAQLLARYDRHHALIGREVRILGVTEEPKLQGLVEGLDAMGRLLVRQDGQIHRVIAGQVELQ